MQDLFGNGVNILRVYVAKKEYPVVFRPTREHSLRLRTVLYFKYVKAGDAGDNKQWRQTVCIESRHLHIASNNADRCKLFGILKVYVLYVLFLQHGACERRLRSRKEITAATVERSLSCKQICKVYHPVCDSDPEILVVLWWLLRCRIRHNFDYHHSLRLVG